MKRLFGLTVTVILAAVLPAQAQLIKINRGDDKNGNGKQPVGPWYLYWPLEAHFQTPASPQYPYWSAPMTLPIVPPAPYGGGGGMGHFPPGGMPSMGMAGMGASPYGPQGMPMPGQGASPYGAQGMGGYSPYAGAGMPNLGIPNMGMPNMGMPNMGGYSPYGGMGMPGAAMGGYGMNPYQGLGAPTYRTGTTTPSAPSIKTGN